MVIVKRRLAALLLITALPITAMAVEITGKVVTADNQPIAGAMITIRSASAAATITKVFSGADGQFRVPNLGDNVYVNSVKASVDKLGFKQQSPDKSSLAALKIPQVDGQVIVNFVMQPITNVAHQVPASAWVLKTADHSLLKDIVNTCSQCHQFPNDRVKNFASALATIDESQREQAWRGMFAAMRVQMYGALQAENSVPATAEQIAFIVDAENSFIDQTDEDLLTPWLAKNFTTSFEHYPLAEAKKWLGQSGVNEHTVIRQFAYDENSFVRETAVLDGVVWVDDISRNRIGKLDQ
ncbi:MAG: carboxypeptidase regulatory-like domain-containing protein, partial [Immundisolibacteraceae bacterium]|nr:carboxypeptidase regulatory-like domain-containing protein [Immundisolibacteraceae bacterium]